jgi:hypothetical protein
VLAGSRKNVPWFRKKRTRKGAHGLRHLVDKAPR